MITVFGRLLASFFDAQAAPVPVTGRVLFTPNFSSEQSTEGVHLPTRLSVKLDDDGRFEVHLLPGDWSWKVEVIAKDQTERTLTVPCFNFLPTPGVDRVNFADIVPLTDPVTGVPMLRGEDGVGVEAITTEAGELIFTLTNGTESRIPVPQGIPGAGVDNITLQGDELVFALSDGSETRIPAPVGIPGGSGVGISSITLVDGELVFTLTDGAETRLPAPKGDPGDPGVSPPAPTLSVGNVATLPNGSTATAKITGTTPNYTLALGIPQGAPGAKGDKGDQGNPTAMTLVGVGRPDNPATLSTANQTAVANAAIGASFTSTDGAGTGAWAWVKTPTGWAVTYADTGWRDITSLASLPANASWAAAPAGVFVRRQDGLLTVVIRGLTTTAKTSLTILSLPTGFRASKTATDMTSIPTLNDSGDAFTGKITFCDGVLVQAKTVAAARLDAQFTIPARDAWPSTQPGTAGNL